MNFAALREFAKNRNASIADVASYLSYELAATMRELRTGLLRLSFADNFESFEKTILIPVSSEVAVTNELSSIPKGYIVLKKDAGGLSVCDGDAAWTLGQLFLKNVSATNAANVTVRFFK